MLALLVVLPSIYVGSLAGTQVAAQATANAVMNEVEMDPPGPDIAKQWIELYNPTNQGVDVSGWKLRSASGAVTTMQSRISVIPSLGYLVLTLPGRSVMKTGDTVTLSDRKGTVIDSTPNIRDVSDNNLTWQRFPNGIDTGALSDWRFSPSTKGATNGKLAATLTLASPVSSATYGDAITLSGKLNLTMSTSIYLLMRFGSSSVNQTLSTTNDGTFSYVWSPSSAGGYTATAFWKGDSLHDPATSSTVSILVNKLQAKLTLSPTSMNLTEPARATFTGAISPTIPQALITITIITPNQTVESRAVQTSTNGSFRFTFVPSFPGNWTLTASWEGDANHYGDQSAASIVRLSPVTEFDASLLILITIPVTIAVVAFVYRYAGTPLGLPLGQILKRRAPPHLRPLRVLNGAICPMCFRPMMYEPKGADWHCEHCGVFYESQI